MIYVQPAVSTILNLVRCFQVSVRIWLSTHMGVVLGNGTSRVVVSNIMFDLRGGHTDERRGLVDVSFAVVHRVAKANQGLRSLRTADVVVRTTCLRVGTQRKVGVVHGSHVVFVPTTSTGGIILGCDGQHTFLSENGAWTRRYTHGIWIVIGCVALCDSEGGLCRIAPVV
jgi:hypothetical protein